MDTDELNHGSRKRRHPASSTLVAPKTSSEILQLIEHANFEELARWNSIFQEAWNRTRQHQKDTGKPFSACVNQEFTVALTRALLQTHLGLELPYLEQNHLCPPVPNRFFYLHWIHTHLLPQFPSRAAGQFGLTRGRAGIDIGAGATCIYSLLAAKFFQTRMTTTEIHQEAAAMALSNVAANGLTHKIQVCHVTPTRSQDPSQPLGGPLARALAAYASNNPTPESCQLHQRPPCLVDFVMTNPPFYDPSSMEHVNPRVGDGRARTAMTVSEGTYPGGEVGFVTEMIADSLQARYSSRWYSSMIGKKTSLIQLQKLLVHLLGPGHVELTEYGPGQYTRWFLAWTFERPIGTALTARVRHDDQDQFRVTTLDGTLTAQDAVQEVVHRVVAFCESSPGKWQLMIETSVLSQKPPVVQIQIQEAMPPALINFVDEAVPTIQIPGIILESLRGKDNSQLLPAEGHFVIQASVDAVPSQNGQGEVMVRLVCYRHSARGQTAITKICSSMQAEVCRTNRKWRRIHQRGMQQP